MDEGAIILAIGFAVVALIAPLAMVQGFYRLQEISEAWRKLADRHRLHFDPGHRVLHRTTVSGQLSGRDFSLKRSSGNKNSNAVYMELLLTGSLPAGLELHPGDRSAARSQLSVEASGDGPAGASVDTKLRTVADNPEDIPTYLTPRRTNAAFRLAEIGGSLEGHKLRVPMTYATTDLEELDHTLRVLRQVAPILDSSYP